MQYLLTPYAKPIPPFAWWEGAFTEQELDWLQDKAKRAEQTAQVGNGNGGGSVNTDIRRSQVSWLQNTQDTEWVFKKLADVINPVNADHFNFDIRVMCENLQLTNYNDTEKGMYGWHLDYNSKDSSRKLSMVVQLTDPSEYEGGNLQIKVNNDPVNVRKQRGLIAIFPSYVLHQVTPVTQGTRQSLVAWVEGPAFK